MLSGFILTGGIINNSTAHASTQIIPIHFHAINNIYHARNVVKPHNNSNSNNNSNNAQHRINSNFTFSNNSQNQLRERIQNSINKQSNLMKTPVNNNDNNHHSIPSNSQRTQASNAYDISGWQGSLNSNEASQLKNEVNFVILKADQGTYQDSYFANNAQQLENVGLPYGVYDYSVYKNPSQAQSEASSLIQNAPHAKFYVNDSEINDAGKQLDTSTQAWANQIHYLTSKPAILYSDYSFLDNEFSQSTRDLYNGIWVASYGSEPDPSWHYDLWQYSDNQYSSALNQKVDADKFPDGNDKSMNFWTGGKSAYHAPKRNHHNNVKSNSYKHHTHHHKHRRKMNHHYAPKRKHYNHTYPTLKNFYHKIPQARWLKVIRKHGIVLYGKHGVHFGTVKKGTILYVNRYIKVMKHKKYYYKAQGFHWGRPDWFSASMKSMTDKC